MKRRQIFVKLKLLKYGPFNTLQYIPSLAHKYSINKNGGMELFH